MRLPEPVKPVLQNLKRGQDGIYSSTFMTGQQDEEVLMRRSVATKQYTNYLAEISLHHSIPVMDQEVRRFLRPIRPQGIILDSGGCWGWHWRDLKALRPDTYVIILDFVRENLLHAKQVLGEEIDERIFLVHGTATDLPFADASFDGYWSVQTLQHIPDFAGAVQEACRTLKPGGLFANYSLNYTGLVKSVYKSLGRTYHYKGVIPGSFYLERMSPEQLDAVAKSFGTPPDIRFTEILFNPDLGIRRSGRFGSLFGRLDAALSSGFPPLRFFARQMSCHSVKPSKP